MATIDTLRNQTIKRAVVQRPESIVEVTIDLWERLASELILIIGDGGFQSLYARSVHLTKATFPLLDVSHPLQQSDSRFAGLKISLAGREFAEASEASTALLITFVDVLALLIGEPLTNNILRSAWGDDALDLAAKDLRK